MHFQVQRKELLTPSGWFKIQLKQNQQEFVNQWVNDFNIKYCESLWKTDKIVL